MNQSKSSAIGVSLVVSILASTACAAENNRSRAFFPRKSQVIVRKLNGTIEKDRRGVGDGNWNDDIEIENFPEHNPHLMIDITPNEIIIRGTKPTSFQVPDNGPKINGFVIEDSPEDELDIPDFSAFKVHQVANLNLASEPFTDEFLSVQNNGDTLLVNNLGGGGNLVITAQTVIVLRSVHAGDPKPFKVQSVSVEWAEEGPAFLNIFAKTSNGDEVPKGVEDLCRLGPYDFHDAVARAKFIHQNIGMVIFWPVTSKIEVGPMK